MSLFASYEPGAPRRLLDPALVVRTRLAEPGDAPALGRLRAEREGTSVADSRRIVAAQITNPDGLLLLAELSGGEGDETVGFGRVVRFEPPAGAGSNMASAGWYLGGVLVDPRFRRHGIGRRLTEERLAWVARRARRAYYVASVLNRASIDLHAALGFVELVKDIVQPGVTFTGGHGSLFGCELDEPGA